MDWKEVIKDLRISLSVKEIASHIGVSVQAIYQIGDGIIEPKQSTGGALKRLLKREHAVQRTRERHNMRDNA